MYCNADVCDLAKHTLIQFDMLTIPGKKLNIVQVKTNTEITWSDKNYVIHGVCNEFLKLYLCMCLFTI